MLDCKLQELWWWLYFFGVPKTSVDTWTKIISTINGQDTKIMFVCEKYCLPQDKIKNYAGLKVWILFIARFLINLNWNKYEI